MTSDYTFPDGTYVNFDFDRITQREFLSLVDSSQTVEEGNELVAKVAGVEADKFLDLTRKEYRKFIKAFYAKDRGTADPN